MIPASASLRRPATALGLVAATALVLSGCSSAGGASDGSDRLQVVATTTQLTDFAGVVGGEDIELTGLLPPGGSAHHFDPSPADLLALGSADVLVTNGAGLEEFLDDAIEASGFAGTVIDASEGLDLAEAKEITLEAATDAEHEEHEDHDHDEHAEEHEHDHDHADEEHDHADEDHDHAEDEHDHDHDHGDLNPHLWTAPRLAEGMVTELAAGLGAADPDHATDYEARAESYLAQLDELDTWVAAQFERIPAEDRVLVSGHDSLRYYLHDYDIEFAGSILPSFEDNAEPSAAEIDQLVHAIEERGVSAVFVESSMSPKLAETIAAEAGVEVVTEDALYADSLGEAGSEADTYIGATVHNTRTIVEAWGGEVDSVPDTLE